MPGIEAQAASDDAFDFDALAAEVAETLGTSSTDTLQEVLNGPGFVHSEIGAFDVFIPIDVLSDRPQLALIQEAILTLVDVQAIWYSWRGARLEGNEPPIAQDWKILRKWVGTWSTSKFGRIAGGPETLSSMINAKDKIIEAQARLRLATAAAPEVANVIGERKSLVFLTTRESFIRTVALAGLLNIEERSQLWSDLVLQQTACWSGWTQIACLVGIAFPFDMHAPFGQSSLSREESTGLAQYVAERGAVQILRSLLYLHGTAFFEEALGADLVIAAVGRNDLNQGEWEISVRRAGGRTQPYSRFVPGGNPNGGTLPKRNASPGGITASATYVSSYRAGGGVNFFQTPLKEGQKDGAKLASKERKNPLRKNKLVHFLLHSPDPVSDTFISAPFLGQNTEGKALPADEFLDDYEDFFRAYRSCFVRWLQEHGSENETDPLAKFQELIRKHSARDLETPMYEVVEAVYGIPMSSMDPEVDSLERRFLAWLRKGR